MGKKDKNKKAGKGAEKTAMKTLKKLKNKSMKLTGEVRIWNYFEFFFDIKRGKNKFKVKLKIQLFVDHK